MFVSMFTSYPRTLVVVAALVMMLVLIYGGITEAVYPMLLSVFEWLETTWFGVIGKTWGAAFAFATKTNWNHTRIDSVTNTALALD